MRRFIQRRSDLASWIQKLQEGGYSLMEVDITFYTITEESTRNDWFQRLVKRVDVIGELRDGPPSNSFAASVDRPLKEEDLNCQLTWNAFRALPLRLAASYTASTVAIKSIRRSQVTGLLILTKGHRGQGSQMNLTKPFFGPPKRLPEPPNHKKISSSVFQSG